MGAALCAMTCAGFETGDNSVECAAKDSERMIEGRHTLGE